MINLENLVQEQLNIKLTASQTQAFQIYESLLLEWNQKFNLTAITDPDDIRLKHFYDSLTCLKVIQDENASMIDIGCGAGFPGIPLKIMLPGLRLVLVESVRKKTNFCSAVVDALQLDNVSVLHARAEDLGRDPDHRKYYDWAVARAVAAMPVLSEYLLPLVRIGGNMLAQKGTHASNELAQAKNAIAILGGQLKDIQEFSLPVNDENRALVVIEKIKTTPAKYPRKAGTPSKKPLC
jgi:16S rRNA (guanine527-N7)-methyltransferase